MTKLCNSCEYLKFCARSGIEDVGCDRYKKDTTTNEEWLKSCTTEQLAEFIVDAMVIYDGNRHVFVTEAIEMAKKKNVNLACDSIYKDVVEWLKQPHRNE